MSGMFQQLLMTRELGGLAPLFGVNEIESDRVKNCSSAVSCVFVYENQRETVFWAEEKVIA